MKRHHLLVMVLCSLACTNAVGVHADDYGCDDGCFEPQSHVYSSYNITDVSVIDFDGDGTDDVVVAHDHSSATLMRGDVSGLSVFGQVPIGVGQVEILAGDFDADFVMDLVVLDANMKVNLMRGDGDGGFTSLPPLTDTSCFGHAKHIASGDLDGDLRPDVVVLFDDMVVVFITNDHSHLTVPTVYDVPGAGKSLSVVDIDGINGPDIVVGSHGDTHVSVLANLGQGTFVANVVDASLQIDDACTGFSVVSVTYNDHVLMTAPLDDAFEHIVTGDFDGDGNADTVVSTSSEVYAHYSRPCD